MRIHIKNMVCNRCKWVVQQIFEKEGISVSLVELGTVDTAKDPDAGQLKRIGDELNAFGFEIINDKSSLLIEQIRQELMAIAADPGRMGSQKLSGWLAEKFHRNYSGLSKFFSEVEGVTIEQYVILQRIEKVKELLIYDEQSLSDIAYSLGYSSAAHLSNQFRKVTGMTPREFRQLRNPPRKSLDQI